MKRLILRLLRSQSGAVGAEFAMVVPLLLVLLFGIVDGGRFMWTYNQAEKATQVGTRVAIVTNVLSSGLVNENYVGQTPCGTKIASGDRIPVCALGTIKCTGGACTCEVAPCPADLGTFDSDTFNNVVVARMQQIDPSIQAANVIVRYSGSGLGFADDSSGEMQVSPLITVSLTGMRFKPVTLLLFASLNMPDFSTTLPAEDASGSYSN